MQEELGKLYRRGIHRKSEKCRGTQYTVEELGGPREFTASQGTVGELGRGM